MPKGVEHVTESVERGLMVKVPTAVMPKGVEHPWEVVVAGLCIGVPTAVMPKGVEHKPRRWAPSSMSSQVPTAVMPKGVEHIVKPHDTLPDIGCRQQ
jgi:hypothetical protein